MEKNAGLGCVWFNVKYFIFRECYFRERKIFSSVWLHYENCSRKYFHVFGNILKMLFSYKFFTFSQPFSQHPNKFYYRKFQNIHLTQPKIKIKTLIKRKKEWDWRETKWQPNPKSKPSQIPIHRTNHSQIPITCNHQQQSTTTEIYTHHWNNTTHHRNSNSTHNSKLWQSKATTDGKQAKATTHGKWTPASESHDPGQQTQASKTSHSRSKRWVLGVCGLVMREGWINDGWQSVMREARPRQQCRRDQV